MHGSLGFVFYMYDVLCVCGYDLMQKSAPPFSSSTESNLVFLFPALKGHHFEESRFLQMKFLIILVNDCLVSFLCVKYTKCQTSPFQQKKKERENRTNENKARLKVVFFNEKINPFRHPAKSSLLAIAPNERVVLHLKRKEKVSST